MELLRKNKRVPGLFVNTGSLPLISVHRLIPDGEDKKQHPDLASNYRMAKIGDKIAKKRSGKHCHFYGWATLSVSVATEEGRIVVKSPTKGNPWHATIVLPGKVVNDLKIRQHHDSALIDAASWRPRPGGE